MQMCDNHWAKLRQGIKDRGLDGFVSRDGEAAIARMAQEVEGRTAHPPDPLMSAHNMIVNHAMETFGLELMVGEKCPVCEFVEHIGPPPPELGFADNEAYMTDGPLDQVLLMFVNEGWIPSS